MFVKVDAIHIVNVNHIVFVEGYDMEVGMIIHLDNGGHFTVASECYEKVLKAINTCNRAAERLATGAF